VVCGFVGAFVGATLFEYSRARRSGGAVRAGWGAVLGRAAAAALKMAIGVVLAVWALFLALGG
jgi:predicted outer membrane repeat protein